MIKNDFVVYGSKQIEFLNVLSKNIKINKTINIFYKEEYDKKTNLQCESEKEILKNINLSIEKANYVKFIFELENNTNLIKNIKLNEINKVNIKFSTELEKKVEDNNNNIELVVNFDSLLKIYQFFKDIIIDNTNKLNITEEYNTSYSVYVDKQNNKKIKEFLNFFQNNKNNNELELKILNYFCQHIKDKKWLENNLSGFKNYKKIINKINNKVIYI